MMLEWKQMGIVEVAALVIGLLASYLIHILARSRVQNIYVRFGRSSLDARRAADGQLQIAVKIHDEKLLTAQRQRDAEVQATKDRIAPLVAKLKAARDGALQAAAADYQKQIGGVQAKRDGSVNEAAQWRERSLADLRTKKERDEQMARARHQHRKQESRQHYDASRAALEQRLHDGLAHTQAPIEDRSGVLGQGAPDWAGMEWSQWKPPAQFASVVRFGDFEVDLRRIADGVPRRGELKLRLPSTYSAPALLGFPQQASLLIEADRAGRIDAILILPIVMTRLLTSLPPRRVPCTLIVPVGLG